jgi:hypothetical protein
VICEYCGGLMLGPTTAGVSRELFGRLHLDEFTGRLDEYPRDAEVWVCLQSMPAVHLAVEHV